MVACTGGIEFALPVDEHGYLTAQPWDASVTRQGDGGATVVLQVQEATRDLRARVEVTLRPGEAAIRLRTSLFNASGASQQFQYWTNAMLSPGRHGVGPELQITFPADQVVVHSTGDTSLPPAGATMAWPVYAGRDLSSYAEWRNWLGFFGPQRWAPFVAVYDQATQIGMVHASTAGVLAGAKVFGFGRDFDDRTFSDDGAQYIEVWSGLTPTFEQTTSLPAGGTVAWNEVWYVVSQSGGVTFANQNASLYAWRDGDVVRLTVASPSAHRWHLTAAQNGMLISDQVFRRAPGYTLPGCSSTRGWRRWLPDRHQDPRSGRCHRTRIRVLALAKESLWTALGAETPLRRIPLSAQAADSRSIRARAHWTLPLP